MSLLEKIVCSDHYSGFDIERSVTALAGGDPNKFAVYVKILRQGDEVHGFGEPLLYASVEDAMSAGLTVAKHHIDGLLK